ncbi:V-type ATP synthase subunit I [Thermoplasmatales archaeon]|nr:V-type ATP synthase subunit I [Thermoplasmatales archaeon]
MVLKPERMERIRIIAANRRKKNIISALHNAEAIQIEPASQDFSKYLSASSQDSTGSEINDQLQRMRGFEAALPFISPPEKASFSSTSEMISKAKEIKIDDEIRVLKSSEESLKADMRDIENRMSVVEVLRDLDYDMSVFNNAVIQSYLASDIDEEQAKTILDRIPGSMLIKLDNAYSIVSCSPSAVQELAKTSNEFSVHLSHIPEVTGKPAEYYRLLNEKMKEKLVAQEDISTSFRELSEKHYHSILQLREALEIESRKADLANHLLGNRDVFSIEGWVPASRLDDLDRILNRVSDGMYILSRVDTDEEPPTLLNNPRHTRLFEFFIKFYSLPQGTEYDPTVIFAIIFPFFFGIMVGDWGYGIIILLMSLWIIHRLDHPVSKSHIPKVLSGFVLMIMKPGSLKVVARALIPGSIVAIAAGIVFNAFFGFQILPFTLYNPIKNIGKLLLFSGYVGIAMVSFGLVLGMMNEHAHGNNKGAAGKLGWLFLAWGITMIGLLMIYRSLSFSNPLSESTVALALLIAGIVLIAATEKTQGLMEIPSIISHVLSYLRIIGILLASVILASVIDLIFEKGMAKSPLFAVVAIIVLIVGQIFNLAIAVFEPGIQGARLLFVEFFSKFYKGNGKSFRPFSSRRKYTIPDHSAKEE